MSEGGLHVVFGTGQVGLALAARLAGQGVGVRAVSRRRPAALRDGVDWRPADVTDLEAATDAAKGASLALSWSRWKTFTPTGRRAASR